MKNANRLLAALYGFGLALLLSAVLSPASAQPRHGIAMHGEPALPPHFTSLPYANPNAPQGGRIVFGALGTFDTLNPYVVRGIAASGLAAPMQLVYQTLMMRSADEPFTLYGLVAETIEVPEDRSSVTFRINPLARFSDGTPIKADDVLFTWRMLKEKGKPNFRFYYSKAKKAEALDERTVRFTFADGSDRELPLIFGLMPVLSENHTDILKFGETDLNIPIGSGPYIIAAIKPGESVLFKRNPDFWGKNLPILKGLYNADEIRFDYFRDANSLFEAFKGGLYDIRLEDSPTRWISNYDFPAMQDGRVVKDPIVTGTPKGMSALVFNTRKPIFADIRVREALGLMFDFNWVNTHLFNGLYKRTDSYFAGSELASAGHKASAQEREWLAPYAKDIRPDILEGQWRPFAADGSGRDRNAAREALSLLQKAGWSLRDGTLKNNRGEAFIFEILVVSRVQERLAINFSEMLKRIGVTMRVRLVDDVQYWRRVAAFDFDMIQFTWGASPSPGNEQYNRWGGKSAEREGSLNYAGAQHPAIDAMIDQMLRAQTREEFVSAVRALDRVLLSQFYVIPLFYAPEQWVARTARIQRPKQTSLFGFAPETLWVAPQ
jgi:peptide/nickel transport system substrate-binding protein